MNGLARYSSDRNTGEVWIYDLDDSQFRVFLQDVLEGPKSSHGSGWFVAGGTIRLILIDVDANGRCRERRARAVFFNLNR
jgi:hypothetical protein